MCVAATRNNTPIYGSISYICKKDAPFFEGIAQSGQSYMIAPTLLYLWPTKNAQEMPTYNIAIIGAGIVGLGTAYQILERQPDLRILVLDKASSVSAHQSGHNSGVIHSGIYYKPGSLRAVLCQRGYRQMVDFCVQHQITHQLCGKIIVAVKPDELPRLDAIYQRGVDNGMQGLRRLHNLSEIQEIEPHAGGLAAIYVPQAGIVNYRRVAEKYAELIQQKGAHLQLNTRVLALHPDAQGGQVVVTDQGDFHCQQVISCAGLYSDKLSRMTLPEADAQILPFRGEYYQLKPEAEHLVRGLIYPVPNPNFPFLGVHFTRLAEGGVEAGPNAVLAFAREGYTRTTVHWGELAETLAFPGFRVLARRYWRDGLAEMKRSFFQEAFVAALKPLVPAIQSSHLSAGGAGVRAMACSPSGELIDDFLFYETPGVIHVANAPSPAATASLAIGETIAAMALKQTKGS